MTAILSCPYCKAPAEEQVGYEVRGVFDGVLWWECLSCGVARPRDFGGRSPELAGLALRYATEHNMARGDHPPE